MITLVEAANYRCLRYVRQRLRPFHVLVGPNASGKTTFLDVIGFLRDVVSEGLDEALANRTPNPQDLLFGRRDARLELAVEAAIPEPLRARTLRPNLDAVRYQIAVGFDETGRQFEFKAETLLLRMVGAPARGKSAPESPQRTLFPQPPKGPDSLLVNVRQKGNQVIVNKTPGGNDIFYGETKPRSKQWSRAFRLGPRKSALGNLPADTESFPVATWFRDLLAVGVQRFMLNSGAIRRPSPPTKVAGFLPDGSNLPWVIARMQERSRALYEGWLDHLRTALPDLENIEIVERPEDRHCYMIYRYANEVNAPSWMVSDGTLRLTALTLPAYLIEDDFKGIYLIEEPENGIHPRAVATAYDSLSSVYGAQVLLASHSPVVLNAAGAADVLCFAKDDDGATDIVLGSDHPRLRQWQGEAPFGTLLASGVLG